MIFANWYNNFMTDSTYKKALEKLNKKQQEAVEKTEGPVVVIAGPGTGKTQILTTRIAHILHETDTPPSAILALTFTEAGAVAMRTRLKELIGRDAYSVQISTFHSFANGVIEAHPDYFSNIIGARQCDSLEQRDIFEKVLHEGDFDLLKPSGDQLYYLKHIPGAIKDIKSEGFNPNDFERLIEKQVKDFESIEDLYHEKGKREGEMKGKYKTLEKKIKKNYELLRVFREYEQIKADRRVFDYEDAILELVRALEREDDLLLTLQENYLYILADEHQDSNRAQNKILDHLSSFHDNPNIFIVGDDKQAIYRFQGASLENFLYFTKRYPEADIIELQANYRSSEHILNLSQELILHNPTLSKKPLKQKVDRDEIKTSFVLCSSELDESQFIAREVKSLIKLHPEETIAVLFRNNREAHNLETALEREEINYTKRSGSNGELHPHTEQLLTLLRIADEPTNENVSRALFFDCFNLNVLEITNLLEGVRRNQSTISEQVSAVESEVARVVRRLYELHKLSFNISLYELFEEVLHGTGLIKSVIASNDSQRALSEIQSIYSKAKLLEDRDGEVSLQSFLEYIARAQENNSLQLTIPKDENSRVVLSTVHSVKGLEFDSVFITGLEDKRWGGKKKAEYFYLPEFKALRLGEEERMREDERRLFYVALTRAMRRVIITFPKTNIEGREFTESQFIDELGKDVERREYVGDRSNLKEKRVVQKRSVIDSQFIEKLFWKRGLNPTAVNKYLTCPWEYFFLTLLRLPQAPSSSAAFGTAVHSTLQIFFDKRTAGVNLTPEEVATILKDELNNSRLEEADKERYFSMGKEALAGYIELGFESWPLEVETERSIRGIAFETPKGDALLSGKLDKIEKGSEKGLIVTDFKTGKPKSRNHVEGKTQDANGDYKRQLVFYALLLDLSGEHMEEGVIDFIQPNERGIYKQERFIVTDEEMKELGENIKTITEEVLSGAFVDKGCNKKTCEWCRLSEVLFSSNN